MAKIILSHPIFGEVFQLLESFNIQRCNLTLNDKSFKQNLLYTDYTLEVSEHRPSFLKENEVGT